MSQTSDVLAYIEKCGSIDPIRAMNDLHVMRLASRIADLRKAGIPIETEIVYTGRTRWAVYKKAAPGVQTEERQEGEAVEGSDFASKNNTSNT